MGLREEIWDFAIVSALITGAAAALAAVVFVGALIGVALFADGCGYSAKSSEMVGQVKSVSMETPLICPDRIEADISLGILRSGSGSMSKHDVDVLVPDKKRLEILRTAAEDGHLVQITYDKRRMPWCGPEIVITGVSRLNDPPAKAEVP